jgi:hypothetical protein
MKKYIHIMPSQVHYILQARKARQLRNKLHMQRKTRRFISVYLFLSEGKCKVYCVYAECSWKNTGMQPAIMPSKVKRLVGISPLG